MGSLPALCALFLLSGTLSSLLSPHPSTPGPTGDWSSEGCSTEPGAKQTVCHCDHLTFFALLLRPVLDKDTAQTLTRISQAGCGASMIFLAFTIILYTALRWVMPSPLPPVLQGGGSAG